jgi:cyclopropane fatty-acyl-phospholipid synthase-like methyltransferase
VIEDIKKAFNTPVVRMLDVPCGDMLWMNVFLTNRSDIDYTGMDIVPELIERHKKEYAKQDWTFRVHDIVAESLTTSYDLIISREMMQHLVTGDALTVLRHFSDSGSSFVMMTTFPKTETNTEIRKNILRFRYLNLERPPYSLTPPMCVVHEANGYSAQHSGLWSLPLEQISHV